MNKGDETHVDSFGFSRNQRNLRHLPRNSEIWERFKNFLILLAFTLGKRIEVSKVNLVKTTLFAYQIRCFMYVIKNLGKAGVVPRDVLIAIDELIDEGRLVEKATLRLLPKGKLFGEIEFFRRKINEILVPSHVQSQIYSLFEELDIPMTIFERMGDDLSKILKSKNTKVQERLSLDSLIFKVNKEKNEEQHTYHKYYTRWDVGKELSFLGIEEIKVGGIISLPYPKIGFMSRDPIKRNVQLIMDLLRKKRTLQPKHFWISSIKKNFRESRDEAIGTICLLSGFLYEPLRHDEASKTYVTRLTTSAYNVHPDLQITLILDADTEYSASYLTTLDDLYNYEYAMIGMVTEHEGQPVIKCYGLIAVDELPSIIKKAWKYA